ncbi:unnamed protein product [Spodoptera exigua]|nr:unnamed protein product [Spodoptera exigua]
MCALSVRVDNLSSSEHRWLPLRSNLAGVLRCGVCPTYFQKICAFDFKSNSTFIFDNHCIMDLYNCMESSAFTPIKYEKCLYFGNFAYVHGYKYEDMDYGEDHITVYHSKKNPDFV